MKKKSVEFIYFDIGGVLLRWKGIIDLIAKKSGKTREEAHAVFHSYDDRACIGELHPDDWGPLMSKDFGVDPKTLNINEMAEASFSAIVETHEFAKKISLKYPIGLLTNIYHGHYELFRKHKMIPDLQYAAVVESCKVGSIKPQKEIYRHSQKLTGKQPEEILFLDDLVRNIEAAKRQGWQAIQFDTSNPTKTIQEVEKLLES